jgi:hypothetical protein
MARFLYGIGRGKRSVNPEMKYLVSLILTLFLFATPMAAFAGQDGRESPGVGNDMRTGQQAQQETARSSRLRFRGGDGPTGMCAMGMTDEQIQRAQEERRGRGSRGD